MVASDAVGHHFADALPPAFNGNSGASGGVIDRFAAAVQALLKGRAVFAEVVQLAGV